MPLVLCDVTPEISAMIARAVDRTAAAYGATAKRLNPYAPIWEIRRAFTRGAKTLARKIQIAPYTDSRVGKPVLLFAPSIDRLTRSGGFTVDRPQAAKPGDIVMMPINPAAMAEAALAHDFTAAFAQAWAKLEASIPSERPTSIPAAASRNIQHVPQ